MAPYTLAVIKAQDTVARSIHTARFRAVTEGVTEAGSPDWEQQQAGMGVKWDARRRQVVPRGHMEPAELVQEGAQLLRSVSGISKPLNSTDEGALQQNSATRSAQTSIAASSPLLVGPFSSPGHMTVDAADVALAFSSSSIMSDVGVTDTTNVSSSFSSSRRGSVSTPLNISTSDCLNIGTGTTHTSSSSGSFSMSRGGSAGTPAISSSSYQDKSAVDGGTQVQGTLDRNGSSTQAAAPADLAAAPGGGAGSGITTSEGATADHVQPTNTAAATAAAGGGEEATLPAPNRPVAGAAAGKLAPISNAPRAPSLPIADSRPNSGSPTELLRMQLSAKSLPSLMTAGFDRSVFDHASMTATRVEGGDHGMALSEHRQVTSKIPGVYTARIFQPGKEKEEKQEERDGRMYDALFRPGIYAGGIRGRLDTPAYPLRRKPAATLSRLDLARPTNSPLSRSSSNKVSIGSPSPRSMGSFHAAAAVAVASLQEPYDSSMGGGSVEVEDEEEEEGGMEMASHMGTPKAPQLHQDSTAEPPAGASNRLLQASTTAARFASKHAAPRRVVSLPVIPMARGAPKTVRIQDTPQK